MLIMTAEEQNAARRKAAKREMMGTDFKNHGGAKAKIHADKKQKAKRAKWKKVEEE